MLTTFPIPLKMWAVFPMLYLLVRELFHKSFRIVKEIVGTVQNDPMLTLDETCHKPEK